MSERLTQQEQVFESELRAIAPAQTEIRRDELIFAAGRASAAPAARHLWPWQIATAAAMLICVGLLLHRPEPRTIERVVVVRDTAQRSPDIAPTRPARIITAYFNTAPHEESYLAMRNAILTRGVDAVFGQLHDNGGGGGPQNVGKLEGGEFLPAWQRKNLDGGRS